MKEELMILGLSGNESEIYLATLKLGNPSISRIENLTGMPRPTIYDNLYSLKSKGLITIFKKDKKLHFQALPFKIFLEQLKEKERVAKNLLPKLEKISESIIEKPEATIYEGKKGITSLLEEIYQEKELLVLASAKKSEEILFHIPENLARRRVKSKIHMRALFENSGEALFRVKDPQIKKFTEIRIFNEARDMPATLFIFGSKTAILSLSEEIIGIKVNDPNFNRVQRMMFETIWKRAKPVK